MLRNKVSTFIVSMLVVNVALGDESTRAGSVHVQRVPPSVLKQALGLPEFPERTSKVPTTSMDDLKRLAEKLKLQGDVGDAAMLQRFIQDHEKLTSQASLSLERSHETFTFQCDVFEVNLDELPADSIVKQHQFTSQTNELEAELHRLVGTKQAKKIIDRVLTNLKANETVRARSGSELAVPLASSDGSVPQQFRELGAVVEASASPVAQNRVRIHLTCETRTRDLDNAITIDGTTTPGITKRKTQSVFDADFGETIVQSSPATLKGHRQIVLVKVTRGH